MNNRARPPRKWTERPNAEGRAIMENESMFRLLFERSADAILLFDPATGVFVDCNEAAVDLMRAGTKDALLQLRPAELAPPTQPDGRSSAEKSVEITALVNLRASHRFEWVARRADQTDVPLEVLATPITANGHALHVVVCRDITERKRAETELRENQQLLASVADNLSEAIYRTGPDHELIFANRAYLRLSGYESLEEMREVPREQLYACPEMRARLLESLAREGSFRNQEIEYVRRDGQRWWGLSNSVAIRDPHTGAVLYHVGSVADITERKRAADEIERLNASLERRIAERTAELTASEARLRTLVEHAPEAIVVFDGATGRFMSSNAHACRLYGRNPEELTQLTPAEVSPEFQPDGRRSMDAAREKMAEALAGHAPVFDWIHRHASGRLIATEVRLVRLPAEGQQLLRASIIDNTERNRREKIQQAIFQISEAAHRAEDLAGLYHQIHESVRGLMAAENFYIALLDPVSETFSFPYFVDERDEQPAPMRLSQGLTGYVLRTGQPLLAREDNILRDARAGVAVVAEASRQTTYAEVGAHAAVWLGVPLSLQGKPIGVMALQDYQDKEAYGEEEKRILTFVAGQIAQVIERKRAEQAVRESEEKFRALFEASSQGVMLHDENQYLEVNPAAVRIMGYRCKEDLIGRHPRDTSPPVQPNGERTDVLSQRYIGECLAKGSARFDWVARRATGEDIPLEVILTRIEWGGRQIIQAVINDISERKKAETELLKSLAREKELGQLKSNFVSMVSHEFRTPLGVIMSSAEILESYLEQLEPAERREHLQSIQQNSRRMANLMEEVLLLGMVEAGRMDFKPAEMDLARFFRRLVDELQSATNQKCPVELSLPAETAAFADERLLDHVFTNLLSNAVKYSPAGTPVQLDLERDGDIAVFRIRDRGLGIPEPDLERMFSAFHRGQNVGHVPGTGLGLTIVKRCVELHRGRIKIESTVGHGTTVTVRLPLFGMATQAARR